MATATQLAQELSGPAAAGAVPLSAHAGYRDLQKPRRLRSRIAPLSPRPPRTELERACRIALMETEEPISVETIYDRIVRRGSLMFLSYKRPFRAIALAMGSLVKLGEARLLRTGRERHWHRVIP